MIKQIICWIRTGHANRELVDSRLLPLIEDTMTSNIVYVEKVYKCKDCDTFFTKVEKYE